MVGDNGGPIDFRIFSGVEIISIEEALTKIKTKDLTVKELNTKIVLRNMISKFDGRCSLCLRGIKQGTKIKWSRETGALCHPDCEATMKLAVTNEQNAHGYKRQFDFGENEEDK